MKDKNTTIFRSVMITALFCMALFGIALAAISDVYESDVDGLQSQVDELKGEETSADAESSDSATINDGTVEGAKAFCEAEAKDDEDSEVHSWIYHENYKTGKFIECGIGNDEAGARIGAKFIDNKWTQIYIAQDCLSQELVDKYQIPYYAFDSSNDCNLKPASAE